MELYILLEVHNVPVTYLTVLTILSVPVWALNVDLAWSLSLDNVYNGSEMKQVLLDRLNNFLPQLLLISQSDWLICCDK